eukprot:scaffold52097_cov29-Prasinocladus_malaysianus.AAC.1
MEYHPVRPVTSHLPYSYEYIISFQLKRNNIENTTTWDIRWHIHVTTACTASSKRTKIQRWKFERPQII